MDESGEMLPCPARRWGDCSSYTELLLRHGASVNCSHSTSDLAFTAR